LPYEQVIEGNIFAALGAVLPWFLAARPVRRPQT
jgi:hypothetical protein